MKLIIVTAEDNIAPQINCRLILVVATSAAGRSELHYSVGTDNCTVTTALTAGLASGATF